MSGQIPRALFDHTSSQPVPLVDIIRSGVTECRHRGSIVIVEGDSVIEVIGDPFTVTPMRSTAKPFQLLALLSQGGLEQYNLTFEEIAVMVSSHNGEARHVGVVMDLLHKAGLDEQVLHCGTHPAYFPWITRKVYQETGNDVSQVHNNCSGKHAGMLLLGRILEVDLDGYWKIEHPVQQKVLSAVAKSLDTTDTSISIGVDGCSVPTYNVRLYQLAKAYCNLGMSNIRDRSDKMGVIQAAMRAEPFIVGGSDRLDTDIMGVGPFVAKVGSQGIYCIAAPDYKLGMAIKMESGSEEAAESAAVEMLRKLGLMSGEMLQSLEKYWHRPVLTYTNEPCGHYQPVF